MVYGLQPFYERLLGYGNIAEGDRTIAEVALRHLVVNERVDEFADILFRIFIQRARGSLHRIAHHKDSLLACERVRTRIAERLRVHLLIRMRILVFHVEIHRQALTMMSGDEVADDPRQVIFLSHLQSFSNMTDDDGGTLLLRQLVVRVHTGLVLREESRISHLSYVVIQCAGTHQLPFGSNLIGHLRGEVSNHDTVLECSRRHLTETAQQLVVSIAELKERYRRDKAEGLLHYEHQRIGEEQEEAAYHEMVIHRTVEFRKTVYLYELQTQICRSLTDDDEQSSKEQLASLGELTQGVYGYQPAHELNDDELVLIFHGDGRYKDCRNVCYACRPGVHEHPDEYRCHGERNEVNRELIIPHEHRREHWEDDNHNIEHRYVTRLHEIILTEEHEI